MTISRRQMILGTGATLIGGAALGCGTSAPAGDPADAAALPIDAADPGFAVGGTASVDPDHYRDPFVGDPPAVCELTCEQILGPCRADIDLVRRDISEGIAGLPTRMSMRVVRAGSCAPVAGAAVEIWFTDRNGVYSGPTTQSGNAGGNPSTDFCNGSDPAIVAQLFCRGIQMTDANGVVHFDAIYPGWYPGRATHVHVQVREAAGTIATTQLYFADPLCHQVYTLHPEYRHRPGTGGATGQRTLLDRDSVMSRVADPAPYLYQTELTSAGAILSWATLAVRDTAADPACSV